MHSSAAVVVIVVVAAAVVVAVVLTLTLKSKSPWYTALLRVLEQNKLTTHTHDRSRRSTGSEQRGGEIRRFPLRPKVAAVLCRKRLRRKSETATYVQ